MLLVNSFIVMLEVEMVMLCIDGGKKVKMCLGDVLGVLIGDIGFDGVDIGKIVVYLVYVYVVVC